jgi:hypothetical protein
MNKNYERVKKWREENKEKLKEQLKRYRKKNREKLNEYRKEYLHKKVEELKAKGCTNAWGVIKGKAPKYDSKIFQEILERGKE